MPPIVFVSQERSIPELLEVAAAVEVAVDPPPPGVVGPVATVKLSAAAPELPATFQVSAQVPAFAADQVPVIWSVPLSSVVPMLPLDCAPPFWLEVAVTAAFGGPLTITVN